MVDAKDVQIKNLADCPEYIPLVSKWMWRQWSDGKDRKVLETIKYRTSHCLGKTKIPMTFVAFYKDVPAGVFSLWTNDLRSRQDLMPWLAALYVIPKLRGKGIGTIMQEFAIKKARALKYKSLYLFTPLENYYERTGWSFVEKAPLPDGTKTRLYEYKLTTHRRKSA